MVYVITLLDFVNSFFVVIFRALNVNGANLSLWVIQAIMASVSLVLNTVMVTLTSASMIVFLLLL